MNGNSTAKAILDKLVLLDPSNATVFQANYERFAAKLKDKLVEWDAQMKPFEGTEIVSYHRSWTYLTRRHGLKIVGYIEPSEPLLLSSTNLDNPPDRDEKAGTECQHHSFLLAAVDGIRLELVSGEVTEMNERMRWAVILCILLTFTLLVPARARVEAAPEGQIVWAAPFSISPTLFDPAEYQGSITSMMTFYALHDALLKPMPGSGMAPGLAESWSVARDGVTYEFLLRKNVRFHNGELMTAEDVKFSFGRYRGTAAKLLKEKVASFEVVDPHRVRVRLKEPWSDFMTFFGTPATGAAWIVPKSYVQRVGEDGFKKAPVGAGPYRFVSFTPGVELVLEAHEDFWRKVPAVKRLVFRSVPDDTTRLAMLKRGDVDIAYNLRGPIAEEAQRTPGLKLTRALLAATFWVDFSTGQWDPKSPWHDRRVRLAASLAIDRQAINQAETLGLSRVVASIIPPDFEFAWAAPAIPYDPAQSRKLLAEAGYPNGFDAGDYTCDAVFTSLGEAIITYLGAVGIQARLRPVERAAFLNQWQAKRVTHLLQGASSAFGNAVTRIERHMVTGGGFAFGSYPEIDDLFQQQARERDRAKREALLHKIQRIAYDRVMFAPIWQHAQLNGVRARIDQPGIGLVDYLPYSSPYEDLRIKP